MFGAKDPDGMVEDTLMFKVFVLCHVFNLLNTRKLKNKNVFAGILGNKLCMVIAVTILVLQVVTVEFLNVVGTYTDVELGAMECLYWNYCYVFANWLACQLHSCSRQGKLVCKSHKRRSHAN